MSMMSDAADVIEPFISSDFKRRDRAEGMANSLFWAGLLRPPGGLVDAERRTVNHLSAVMDAPVAERVARALAEAGLLDP